MNTIAIKLGKTNKEFRIERTICGIVITDINTFGIIFSMNYRRGSWVTESAVREIAFFEEELKEIAIKFVKKYKL